jgi:hypothetical protein
MARRRAALLPVPPSPPTPPASPHSTSSALAPATVVPLLDLELGVVAARASICRGGVRTRVAVVRRRRNDSEELGGRALVRRRTPAVGAPPCRLPSRLVRLLTGNTFLLCFQEAWLPPLFCSTGARLRCYACLQTRACCITGAYTGAMESTKYE